MSRHQLFNPEAMAPAVGFSYGAIAGDGKPLYLAGITGHLPDMTLPVGLIAQFTEACRSVALVIEEAGGKPSDLVSMMIYTTEMKEYRASLKPLGDAYRSIFGKHYPPMALVGVSELFDSRAMVELVCMAVIPRGR